LPARAARACVGTSGIALPRRACPRRATHASSPRAARASTLGRRARPGHLRRPRLPRSATSGLLASAPPSPRRTPRSRARRDRLRRPQPPPTLALPTSTGEDYLPPSEVATTGQNPFSRRRSSPIDSSRPDSPGRAACRHPNGGAGRWPHRAAIQRPPAVARAPCQALPSACGGEHCAPTGRPLRRAHGRPMAAATGWPAAGACGRQKQEHGWNEKSLGPIGHRRDSIASIVVRGPPSARWRPFPGCIGHQLSTNQEIRR
jgi:hypothetical protein